MQTSLRQVGDAVEDVGELGLRIDVVPRLFRDRVGRLGKGNDKGKVEAPVRTGTPIWYPRQSRWTSPCRSDTIVELRVFAEVTDAV